MNDMAFELVVLEDAVQQADIYWRNVFWSRPQPEFGPSTELLNQLAPRYGPGGVELAWQRWFDVLTSWEFADTLIGRDARTALAASTAV
jgi:hypothetical protein